jgi:hypothetical protein
MNGSGEISPIGFMRLQLGAQRCRKVSRQHFQADRNAIVMRKLQAEIPTLETLGLPPVFHEIGNGVGETWFVTDDVTRRPPLVDVRMGWLGYEGVAVAI